MYAPELDTAGTFSFHAHQTEIPSTCSTQCWIEQNMLSNPLLPLRVAIEAGVLRLKRPNNAWKFSLRRFKHAY